MIGLMSFRSLNSVMVATLHVAVVAYVLRSFLRPTTLEGSFAVWVPLSILVALFLSMPIGRAITEAFRPSGQADRRICPRCRLGELRPLLRTGSGLFTPITGYRCAGCRTTYRPIGERFVEEVAPAGIDAVNPEGIAFLNEANAPVEEIRFLEGPALNPGNPANIPSGPVSDV